MSVLPVIARELRAASRQPTTFWVRVVGVLVLVGVLYAIVGVEEASGGQVGSRLFGALHLTLLCSIWTLVPLLTADCISREKREGTLPLLFLTPLKPHDIVNAKGTAHGLRALTLWLAVIPVLTVPLLAGGVSGQEIGLSVLANLSSLFLALAAGITASAGSRVWSRALTAAVICAFCFAVLLLILMPLSLVLTGQANPRRFYYGSGFGLGFLLLGNFDGVWQQWLSVNRGRPWSLTSAYFLVTVASLLLLAVSVLFASWRVRRSWREEPASARVQWLQRKLTKPVFFQDSLKKLLRWQLKRNPIGWLEQRTWSSRLIVWSWFAVVVCVYSSLLANFYIWQRAFHSVQTLLASLLAGSMALSAAGSFRRERETGVLELLLVAPIHESQIIAGRLRGLWIQFLPSIILLCSIWVYAATFLVEHPVKGREVFSLIYYCTAFAALPAIGLYYSLARATFMSALLMTLLVGVVLPAGAGNLIFYWLQIENSALAQNLIPAMAQAGLAVFLVIRLHHNLKHRRFFLEGRNI